MGKIHPPKPVLLLLAAFSQSLDALDWAKRRAAETWGPVLLESEPFDFVETDYYQPTMGEALKKQFFAFENLLDPGELPTIKRKTNDWESEYAKIVTENRTRLDGVGQGGAGRGGRPEHDGPAPINRPLNLDPGYISEAKLVLASTKDHAHRIYLAEGIYAEVTLYYQAKQWRHRDWTFPDYRRDDYQAFFITCRNELRQRHQAKNREANQEANQEGGSK